MKYFALHVINVENGDIHLCDNLIYNQSVCVWIHRMGEFIASAHWTRQTSLYLPVFFFIFFLLCVCVFFVCSKLLGLLIYGLNWMFLTKECRRFFLWLLLVSTKCKTRQQDKLERKGLMHCNRLALCSNDMLQNEPTKSNQFSLESGSWQ